MNIVVLNSLSNFTTKDSRKEEKYSNNFKI